MFFIPAAVLLFVAVVLLQPIAATVDRRIGAANRHNMDSGRTAPNGWRIAQIFFAVCGVICVVLYILPFLQ